MQRRSPAGTQPTSHSSNVSGDAGMAATNGRLRAAIALSGFSAVRSYSGAPMFTMTCCTSLARGRRMRLRRLMIGVVDER
jgi:hypothetical protein